LGPPLIPSVCDRPVLILLRIPTFVAPELTYSSIQQNIYASIRTCYFFPFSIPTFPVPMFRISEVFSSNLSTHFGTRNLFSVYRTDLEPPLTSRQQTHFYFVYTHPFCCYLSVHTSHFPSLLVTCSTGAPLSLCPYSCTFFLFLVFKNHLALVTTTPHCRNRFPTPLARCSSLSVLFFPYPWGSALHPFFTLSPMSLFSPSFWRAIEQEWDHPFHLIPCFPP